MIVIKKKNEMLVISDNAVAYYLRRGYKLLGHLKGEYESLKRISLGERKVQDIEKYLSNKIKEHDEKIREYSCQLKEFRNDLTEMGVLE